MGEALRAIALLVLVAGAYYLGKRDGNEHKAELVIAANSEIRGQLEKQGQELVAAERRIQELESTAASAGTRTRTVIRQATDLSQCRVPAAVSDGLQAQMARTARFGVYRGTDDGGGDGERRADEVELQ